ncbi:TetR/AcrR family transcriptional regulator [Nocardia otitidiscaviarum]|uniref:TetR/AcrR family transcriptional regulator n=1 Tax=Nocardia otitidiscaviarum TaxID=1823 RepID=A0A516NJQ6_9NOCA|nr:TetR/AcrR family transcriptional regulator [Nocardia otitidiscaviarum]MCP9619016.1 TetR/AcrR family transcriptional regulator [Nocardia otitidiscaviarum]QDP79136.1 TetR/AcrR family transcriptional regulator [Nocardia otitidiscaviarum]
MTTRARRRRDPEQTRAAIIAALLESAQRGEFTPTTKALAERAGVSERSIFVHFPTREDLLVALTDEQSERVEALITTVDPGAPLPDRVEAVVRQSAAVFALQRKPRVLGLLLSPTVAAVDDRMRLADTRIRDGLARVFEPELTRDGTRDEQLLDLIEAAAAWPVHHHLIERRGAAADEAAAAVRRALLALLRT